MKASLFEKLFLFLQKKTKNVATSGATSLLATSPFSGNRKCLGKRKSISAKKIFFLIFFLRPDKLTNSSVVSCLILIEAAPATRLLVMDLRY